jgi:hypothetical protein
MLGAGLTIFGQIAWANQKVIAEIKKEATASFLMTTELDQ